MVDGSREYSDLSLIIAVVSEIKDHIKATAKMRSRSRLYLKVARLQSEFWHELFLRATVGPYEKCSEIFSRIF